MTHDTPLNAPDVEPEEKRRQLEGEEAPGDQDAVVDIDEIAEPRELTDTEIYEGELEAGERAPFELPPFDELASQELRDGETDDPNVAAEEGLTWVPPTDPPVVPADNDDGIEVAAGFGVTSLDEPYDEDHHAELLPMPDEMTDRVREALRADAQTTDLVDDVEIETDAGTVILRGVVPGIQDVENLMAVAAVVDGVDEVVDELELAG